MKRKKVADRVVLIASIEESQHEALRYIAYREKRSIADVAREALKDFIGQKSKEYKIGAVEAVELETAVAADSSRGS